MDVRNPPRQHAFIPAVPISGIGFRLACQQDLLTLYENCYPETNWEQFRDHFAYLLKWQENGRCFILVAETHFTVVGSGQLFFRADMAEIAELSVHPDYRNRGIGTAVINILTHIAQERKTSILEIGADIDNQAALRLYCRLGFGRDRIVTLPEAQEAVILKKYLAQRRKGAEDTL